MKIEKLIEKLQEVAIDVPGAKVVFPEHVFRGVWYQVDVEVGTLDVSESHNKVTLR